jgi:hypothetical protein
MRIPPKSSVNNTNNTNSNKPKKPVSLEKVFPKKAEIKKLTGASIINHPTTRGGGVGVNPIHHSNLHTGADSSNSNNVKKVNFQSSPKSPREVGGGGLSGFAKLQQMAKIKGGGPVVISYESDEGDDGNNYGGRRGNR